MNGRLFLGYQCELDITHMKQGNRGLFIQLLFFLKTHNEIVRDISGYKKNWELIALNTLLHVRYNTLGLRNAIILYYIVLKST